MQAFDEFITRWGPSGANDIANFQSLAVELTQLLNPQRPTPAINDGQSNDYRFERLLKTLDVASRQVVSPFS